MKALYHFSFRLRGEIEKGDSYHFLLVQSLVKWYESGKNFWLYRPVSMTCMSESLKKGLDMSRHPAVSVALVNASCAMC